MENQNLRYKSSPRDPRMTRNDSVGDDELEQTMNGIYVLESFHLDSDDPNETKVESDNSMSL
jgi:hypothetical protein